MAIERRDEASTNCCRSPLPALLFHCLAVPRFLPNFMPSSSTATHSSIYPCVSFTQLA